MLYQFNTSTTSTPSNGFIQFNDPIPSNVTHIYVSETDRNSVNIDTYLDSLNVGDYIKIFSEVNSNIFYIYVLSSTFTSGSGVDDLPVTYVSGNGTFSTNDNIGFTTATKGNTGNSGSSGTSGSSGVSDNYTTTIVTSDYTATNTKEMIICQNPVNVYLPQITGTLEKTINNSSSNSVNIYSYSGDTIKKDTVLTLLFKNSTVQLISSLSIKTWVIK